MKQNIQPFIEIMDTTLRDGGTAIISTGYGEGPNRVQVAIEDALHSPLLRNTDIFTAKELLMVLYVDKDDVNHPFEMEELNQLTQFVNNITQEVDVMWGLYPVEGLGDQVKITLLASGFDISINDDDKVAAAANKKQNLTHDPDRERENEKRIKEQYGEGAINKVNIPGGRVKVFSPEELDDDNAIAERSLDAFTRQRPGIRTAAPMPASTSAASAAGEDEKASGESPKSIDFSSM